MQANNETYMIYALRLEHLNSPNGVIATTFEYDGTQFPVKVTMPDGTTSTVEYSIIEEYLKSVLTDANGHVTNNYKDIRGRDCKTMQHADGQEIETSFYYNAIGKLLSVEHPNKEITTYEYDGLGSTSYITDKDGNATQFVSYKPYGEALVDEHATSFESPWKFNGKKLDSETGLYYYGARYYEPVLALFYGTDRYTEKFPWQSAYSYAGGNPIGNIDVNGDSIMARVNSNDYKYNLEHRCFIDRNGCNYEEDNMYIVVLSQALQTLSESETGNCLLTELCESSSNVVICESWRNSESEVKYDMRYNSRVLWNSKKDAAFGGGAFVSLGHELAHTLDRFSGTMDMGTWFVTPEGKKYQMQKSFQLL